MAAAIPPPTLELAELSAVLGPANTREVTRTFLHDTPQLIADLARVIASETGDSPCQLAAHSLKSTAQLVGAHALSALAAALEARLIAAGPAPTPAEIEIFRAEFARFRTVLGPFVAS
ncbi:MAG: Hpt domain-containing protein [Undibacterium sp.]|nr:Hpt domain-containing protein [Opitutaceae bacterium]